MLISDMLLNGASQGTMIRVTTAGNKKLNPCPVKLFHRIYKCAGIINRYMR